METMVIRTQRLAIHAVGVCALASTILLSGCASTGSGGSTGGGTIVASEATTSNVARVGFLTDYAKLSPAPGGGGVLCWRDADVNWKSYNKVLIERIQVYLAPGGAQKPIDPSDLKTLLDYFHSALVKDLRPEMQIVNTAGPGVLRVRIALTSLVPTNTVDSLVGTAVPYGFVGEIASGAATGRPSGSTPYLGQTGMEAQFRDGASGKVVAECADTEIGRKYAADLNQGIPNAAEKWVGGYLDSFTSWSYAQNAFNKWAAVLAQRLRALRAG
jgi:Protein of unknown function (DUF3313)